MPGKFGRHSRRNEDKSYEDAVRASVDDVVPATAHTGKAGIVLEAPDGHIGTGIVAHRVNREDHTRYHVGNETHPDTTREYSDDELREWSKARPERLGWIPIQ